MSKDPFASGLGLKHERFFADCPDDPEMRESTSFWFFDNERRFGFPRIGIEREATAWNRPRIQCNLTGPGGLIMNGAGIGDAHHYEGDELGPKALGAGPLQIECIEPFRKWRIVWDGPVRVGDYKAMLAKQMDPDRTEPIRYEIELEGAAPAWVQDNSPEKVAAMSEEDAREAAAMGIGWRLEQLVRGSGTVHFRGETHSFTGTGSRIKRQSVRPLEGFAGHCWQSAIFPDGRGFLTISYPPKADGSMFNDAVILQDGKLYPAKTTQIPWLRQVVEKGDDISLILESELGRMQVTGISAFSTYRVGNPDIGGLNLHQGGGIYRLDDMETLGMIERSAHESLTDIHM